MAASQPSRTYDFTGGQNAVADEVDTELNTLYNVLQGNLGDTHVASDALIAQSKLANSVLGYAEVTANQGSLTSSVTDLTSLTTTVTVPSGGRRVRITGRCLFQSTVAGDTFQILIRESSTTLQGAPVYLGTANINFTCPAEVILTPSAGSHTYKLSAQLTNGSGTGTMVAASTTPAFILVETF